MVSGPTGPPEWRWLDLGGVDGPTMVNLFVAVAGTVGRHAAAPTVVVLHPEKPFANVGYHQEAEREVDLEYCRAEGIPVVRRVVGGGAILDGPWEHDYMIIVPNGAPATDGGVERFYDRYLAPIAATLARLGVAAERAGINDLSVGGKKVSANGALALDGSWVLVGDILLDLDVAAMSRVLRVPDEKFRGKLARGMSEWLTSIVAVTGRRPDRPEVSELLREEFERSFGIILRPGALTAEETTTLARLRNERSGEAWTFQKDAQHPRFRGSSPEAGRRSVKIAHDTHLARVDRKSGKLLRVTLLSRGHSVEEVEISGDFFTQPFVGHLDELEAALVGRPLERAAVRATIVAWEERWHVKMLGVSRDDLIEAILDADVLPGPM